MKIERKSKCIFIINGTRIDVRKSGHPLNCSLCRRALFAYFRERNKAIGDYKLDGFVCNIINNRLREFETLENNTVFI